MPELPEVEVRRRWIDAHALDQTIRRVSVAAPRLLETVSVRALARALQRRRFERTQRHGKLIFVRLDDDNWLVLHFGVDGELAGYSQARDAPPHARLVIEFESGFHLAYVSHRKLGHIALVADPRRYVADKGLGPDALALDRTTFTARVRQQLRRRIKAWLMDQRPIAGIGNVYSDEILFQARLHPRRVTGGCTTAELDRLFDCMREVLSAAIATGADPARMPAGSLLPVRRRGGACPRCAAPLDTVRIAGRTGYFCPQCQPNRPAAPSHCL